MPLTPRQSEAVAVQKIARDTCVVAGPGSGKTTVLVEYFERLVASGVDPLRILAITFTDKAANNMREKLARTFQDRAEIRAKLERAYVSTVHGFCARLLKENAIFAGIDPEFYVMDERESLRAQRLAVDEALDAMFDEQPERMRALMRGLVGTDTGAAVLDVYDAIRAAGVGIGELQSMPALPVADVAEAIEELGNAQPRNWRFDQQAHFVEAQEWAERIAAALPNGPEPTLRAIQSFNCDMRKLQRGNRTYEVLKSLRDDLLPELEYSLITAHYAAERATIFALLARFDSLYRERKLQAGGLDYDDLEEYAVRLLEEHPEVRRRIVGQFDHLLMDEFQDTNGRQAKLLDLLRPPGRFYAVGDINQSIYGFRHAEPRVFQDYRDAVAHGSGRLVELVENFRSRADILHAVEAVVDGVPGIENRPLVPGLSFPDKAIPSVEVLAAVAGDVDAALALEAQCVAARILELEGRLPVRQDPAEFRDFAVLVRNSEVLGDFTRAFDNLGIPYVVNRGKGFYETREVVDLMHLLRVLVNPRDEISMAAVLRSPFVEASDEALLRLKRSDVLASGSLASSPASGNLVGGGFASGKRASGNIGAAVGHLDAATLTAFAPDDAAKLARFRDQLARWRAARGYVAIDQLLLRAVNECGYECPAGPRGTANLEKFLAQARAAGARQTLAEFVQEIELLRASKPREPDAPPEDSANAVKIMTVHSAKGLEFPVVFLAAMHKGMEAGPGGISFLPRVGLGARWRHPLGGDDKDDSFQHAIRQQLKQREKEEGHRLLYVAMTRAEEHLVLSLSSGGKKAQNWAAVLKESLDLDLETPRDQIVTIVAPHGQRVPIRVLCVDAPPDRSARHEGDEATVSAQLLARPVLTEQHDSQANVTSIAMFAECPRRYFLSRYLGFEGTPHATDGLDGAAGDAADLSSSDLGKQVHALLAGAAVESPDPQATKLADGFQKSPLGRRASAAATVEREFDFLMEMENLVLRGQIDLWFEERGKTVLVDYKTVQVSATDAPARAERYALQLRLYALALERLNGRAPDEAYVCFLRPNLAVPVDLRPSLFDTPDLAVREFREAQEHMRFPLNEGDHCRTCPHFAGLCPAGSGP
jgi:ATP-dependent exoDNAse (exonuclease V) beta subunit